MISGATTSVLLPLPGTIRTITTTTTYDTTAAAVVCAAEVAVAACDDEDGDTRANDWRSARPRVSSLHFGYKPFASSTRAQL